MSSLNLPPLPPIGGETTGRNVVDVLTGQHRELLQLCDRLTAEPDDQRVLDVVIATLSRHLSAEEQYLYPAVRAVLPDGVALAERELAQDHGLLVTMQQLARGAATRIELITELIAATRRHVEADAADLLPLLNRLAPVEDLIRVGNRIELAEEAAPTRPHPGTTSVPPWNKIVDPAVAVVDKVRDALTRRTTYSRDL